MSSTMISTRKLPQSSTAVDIGCSCGRPKKLSHLFLFWSKPKNSFPFPRPDPYTSSSISTASTEEEIGSGSGSGNSRIGDSVAVVKDSSDPYLDFRHSMLQMILEKEIYSKEELRELLDCFLALNSPYHHEIIVRAFSEIWNGVFALGGGRGGFASRRAREF